MHWGQTADTLTLGPWRRRRRMRRALVALDDADQAARSAGRDPLEPQARPSGPRDWAPPSEPSAPPTSRARRRAPGRSAWRGVVAAVSPVFWAVLAITVFGGVLAWADPNMAVARVGVALLVLGGWVVALCLHEFAHALTALRGGDSSILGRGYLTLNPLRYSHPLLSIVLPVAVIASGGIGLPGGAVEIHQHALRGPRWRTAVSLAGPATNAALAVVLAGLVGVFAGEGHLPFWAGLALLAFLQMVTAVLNLLPIPGLDGWGALEPHLSRPLAAAGARVAPFSLVALLLLLLMTPLGSALAAAGSAGMDAFAVSPWWWQTGREFLRLWS